ncbi:MAG: hypothetical protein ABFS86_06925, partial [Planctomycetota bacterium]
GISRPELRGEVVHVLAAVGRRHPADVMRLMERPRPEVARLVAAAVARWPEEQRRPPLLRLLEHRDAEVRRIARGGLVTMVVVARTEQARLAFEAKRLDRADEHARAALALCPGYGEAGRILVDVISRRGRHGEALSLLATLDLPTVDRHMLRARLLYRQNDHAAALKALEQAYGAQPGHTAALIAAARIHLEKGEDGVVFAMSFIERAIVVSRFDAEAWALRGFVREVHLGRRDLARDDFLRALSLDPGNRRYEAALLRLGDEPR